MTRTRDVATQGGLVLVATIPLSSTGVNAANVFTSAYENYKLEFSNLNFSSGGALTIQLRTGSTTNAANYHTMRIQASGTSLTSDRDATGATWNYNMSFVQSANGTVTIYSPMLTVATFMHGEMSCSSGTTTYHHQASGLHNNTSAFESLAIGTAGATITSGNLRIYGMRN
jgi:hypothetical protein